MRVGRWWPEALLLLASVVLAPLLHAAVFPDGSLDVDEVGYLSQADAAGDGHLTLDADEHDPSFLPFLSTVDGERVIFKYQPLWPALLALSERTTGALLPALGLSAGLATAAAYALGREVTHRRAGALLTAGLFAASPFVLVQSATFLAYLPSATLVMVALAATLAAERTGRAGFWIVAGAALGLTLFHRAFDGALVGVVVALWLVGGPGGRRRLARPAGWLLLGAAPALIALLGYNALTTGNPFTPAFSLEGPNDTVGFGLRSSFAVPLEQLQVDYTPGEALSAFRVQLTSLADWLFGGPLALGLGVAGAVLARSDRAGRLATLAVAAFPLGYLFWWGTANMVDFDLQRSLGPFYWLPVTGPLAALAAVALLRVAATGWRLPAALAGVAVLLAALQLPTVVRDVRHASDLRQEAVDRMVPPVDRGLTLVNRKFPGDRYVEAVVPAHPDDADRPVALDPLGSTARFDLLDRFADRPAFMVRWEHDFGSPLSPVHAARVELLDCTAPAWTVAGRSRIPAGEAADGVVPYRRLGDDIELLEPRSDGRVVTTVDVDDLPEPGEATDVGVGVLLGPASQPVDERDAVELRWMAEATEGGEVRVLGPPERWHRYEQLDGRLDWSPELLGRRVVATARNSAC